MRWIEMKRDEMRWYEIIWDELKCKEMKWNENCHSWEHNKYLMFWNCEHKVFHHQNWYWSKPTEICRQFVNIAYDDISRGRPKGVEGHLRGSRGTYGGKGTTWGGQKGTWGGRERTWGGQERTWAGQGRTWEGPRKDLKGSRDKRWPEGVEGSQGDDMTWICNDYAMISKLLRNFDMKWTKGDNLMGINRVNTMTTKLYAYVVKNSKSFQWFAK